MSLSIGSRVGTAITGRSVAAGVAKRGRSELASTCRAEAITGKTVVVTGGNRGIGLELVKVFLEKGNSVVAACRRPSDAAALQALVSASEGKLTTSTLDVTDEKSVEAWAQGLIGPRPADLDATTKQAMMDVFETNTVGPLLVVQALRGQGLLGGSAGGSIVGNVTSKVGSVDDNGSGGTYAYRASKSALNIVNKSLSIDLAPEGVACVLLHPGWVRTDMTRGNGLIDADESAAGLVSVLEKPLEEINGAWFDYAQKPIPW